MKMSPAGSFSKLFLFASFSLAAVFVFGAGPDDFSVSKVGETYLDEAGSLHGVFPGKYNLVMELDREYALLALIIKEEAVGYVLNPPDGNSSANITFGAPKFPQTDEVLMKSPGFTRFQKREVEIGGRHVQWRQWSDARHLYSDTEFTVPVLNGASGQTQLIHVGVVANFPERRTALEDKLVLTKAVLPQLSGKDSVLTSLAH